jgi:hypothetical protein
MVELEKSLTETLGTRVIIEANAEGGRLLIDFFSPDDLSALVESLEAHSIHQAVAPGKEFPNTTQIDPVPAAAPEEKDDDGLYSVSGFSI